MSEMLKHYLCYSELTSGKLIWSKLCWNYILGWRWYISKSCSKLTNHYCQLLAVYHGFKKKKIKALFCLMLPNFWTNTAFQNIPRLCPSVISVKPTCRWRWVWSIGGMKLTGENWCTWKEICHIATLSTMNLTWPNPGLNSGQCGNMLSTKHLSHCIAFTYSAVWMLSSFYPCFILQIKASAHVSEIESLLCCT